MSDKWVRRQAKRDKRRKAHRVHSAGLKQGLDSAGEEAEKALAKIGRKKGRRRKVKRLHK